MEFASVMEFAKLNTLEIRMTTAYSSVFSSEELEYLLGHQEVTIAREKLGNSQSGKVYFTVPLTDELRATLNRQFALDFSSVLDLPMRWIVGDSAPHVDSGASEFQHSYLVYLNDSEGEFIVDGISYPITANVGYKFSEGLSHKTEGTGTLPRLLVGPMNEFAEPVGTPYLYFSTYITDPIPDESQAIATQGSDIVGDISTGNIGSTTQWRISHIYYQVTGATYAYVNQNNNTIFPSSVFTTIYNNGYDLGTFRTNLSSTTGYFVANLVFYPANLYPGAPCFLEGTKILCQVDGSDTYLPIESMKPGTLVKTSRDGYKKVELIGKGQIQNPGNTERLEQRLYKCSPANYPELTEDVYLTGCHSILVDTITEFEREILIKQLDRIFVTDKKYRLTAFADKRAQPWVSEGQYTIWHFALENENVKMNYGVYASGLLVETCCIDRLRNKSGFTLYN